MTISTPRDNNRVATLIGTLDSNGNTVVSVKVNPTNHALKAIDAATGSSFTTPDAQRDANRVPALWAVSSADGTTPVYVATDVNGNLLVDSS